jgi:ABC-type transport system involved in multi-copper enzyme maturation permease subunit
LTILPIVDRELRVAARGKVTYRLRMVFAVGAVTLAGAIGLFMGWVAKAAGTEIGVYIFDALSWVALVFSCVAGVFLTADCLSEEKREGTIGLLFLTDLRGYDVVLGKLLATSLRSFYGLLAIFPVMAVAFILGGVAEGEFWHTLVAVYNTLFFSLALGMAISVVSRHPHKAMTAALAVVAIFLFLPLKLDQGPATSPSIALLSPLYAMMHADDFIADYFWRSVAVVHLAGWVCLGLASWLAPRTWHEKGLRTGRGWQIGPTRAGVSGQAGRRMRELNPVCWIIARDRWSAYLARLAILFIIVLFLISLVAVVLNPGAPVMLPGTVATVSSATSTSSSSATTTTVSWGVGAASGITNNMWFVFASGCASVLALVLEFWLVAQVCRFYVEARKSGFLELLLVTPIRPGEIFRAHWLALRHLFLPVVAAQILLTLGCGILQTWVSYSMTRATGTTPGMTPSVEIGQMVAAALGVASWCVGLFALVWFSIWMGMTSTKMTLAMVKTFCFVKVLPWFAVSFVTGILFALIASTGAALQLNLIWIFPTMLQGLFIVLNLALIFFARKRAQTTVASWANATAA